jgi:hypothetical protein
MRGVIFVTRHGLTSKIHGFRLFVTLDLWTLALHCRVRGRERGAKGSAWQKRYHEGHAVGNGPCVIASAAGLIRRTQKRNPALRPGFLPLCGVTVASGFTG